MCFPWLIGVEWTFGPVKEYELLDPASSLQDIHILNRGGAQDSYWSFGPVMNNLLLDKTNFYWTLPHVRQTLVMTVFIRFYIYTLISKCTIFR
jgi:hypothetical protein